MSKLRTWLDDLHPHFTKGGKFERYYGLYEMVDTFIYTPSEVTKGSTHVRDGIDLKRTMTYVVVATFFCVLMAFYCWDVCRRTWMVWAKTNTRIE